MPFHSGYGYYGTGDWLWSIFSTVVFIVLVTMAIMLLVRLFSGSRQQGPGPASRPVGGPWFGPGSGAAGAARSRWATPEAEGAERILAERYARGEISEEEYRSRLEVLRQTGRVGGWPQPQESEQQRQSADEPSVASAAWQQPVESQVMTSAAQEQSPEPPVVTSAAQEPRTEEVR
jgi:putative membrane protein